MERFNQDPDAVIAATEAKLRNNHERRYLEYLIDMCRYCAANSSDDQAIRYYTSSALFSYLYLLDKNIVPDARSI